MKKENKNIKRLASLNGDNPYDVAFYKTKEQFCEEKIKEKDRSIENLSKEISNFYKTNQKLQQQNTELKQRIDLHKDDFDNVLKLQKENTELKEKLKTQAKEIFKEIDKQLNGNFIFANFINKYREIKVRFEK